MNSALRFDPNALFKGASVPPWIADFARAPDDAIEDLWAGRARLGHLTPLEPLELLTHWLHAFAGHSLFVTALDEALGAWIDRHWGEPLLGGSARLAADAWTQVTGLIGAVAMVADGIRPLARAPARLRARLLADRRFLNALNEGRARDPGAGAWRALARHQHDRTLLAEWWRLCRLPADEPWYRGPIGIEGLAGLPPENPAHAGGFNKEVAEGLARLGEALERRVREGWMDEQAARDEFLISLRLTVRAYRFEDRWSSFWRHSLTGKGGTFLAQWVRERFPGLVIPEHREPGGNWAQSDPHWSKQAMGIAGDLSQQAAGALDRAAGLLSKQRAYADRTGDTEFFVQSACFFAKSIRDWHPEQALTWAQTAREYEPANGFTWTTETECLRALGDEVKALARAIEAARRFPFDPVVQNTLAEVLKGAERLDEAEAVYRHTLTRGIGDASSYTGLAEVLKAQERFSEAEEQYRIARQYFPNNPFAQTGLAAVQRERRGPSGGHTGPPGAALTQYPVETELLADATLALTAETIAQIVADAYLLRRWARHTAQATTFLPASVWRERARTLLDRLRIALETGPEAAEAYGLLVAAVSDRAQGSGAESCDTKSALVLLREAARRFPGSARVRFALARLETVADQNPQLAWRRLARLDARLAPAQFLGEGRALLAKDPTKGRDALGRLAWWCHARSASPVPDQTIDAAQIPFTVQWSSQIQSLLFDGGAVDSANSLPATADLQARLTAAADSLDDLEEDLVDSHAWA